MGRAARTTTTHVSPAVDAGFLPMLSGGLLGAAEAEFVRLAQQFRRELAPRDMLEALQIDLSIVALTLLRRAVAALAAPDADPVAATRDHARAHKMLTASLREFGRLRKRNLDASSPSETAAEAEERPTADAPAPAGPPAAPRPRPKVAPIAQVRAGFGVAPRARELDDRGSLIPATIRRA